MSDNSSLLLLGQFSLNYSNEYSQSIVFFFWCFFGDIWWILHKKYRSLVKTVSLFYLLSFQEWCFRFLVLYIRPPSNSICASLGYVVDSGWSTISVLLLFEKILWMKVPLFSAKFRAKLYWEYYQLYTGNLAYSKPRWINSAGCPVQNSLLSHR